MFNIIKYMCVCFIFTQAKLHMTTDIKRNILNKSMMGGNSTAQALSANNKSTTMATGIPVALSSTHTVTSSAASM